MMKIFSKIYVNRSREEYVFIAVHTCNFEIITANKNLNEYRIY